MSHHRVRVSSYNVLSSHLSSPSYFTSCQPSCLDPTYRFKKLCEKLDRETQNRSVICLQEISSDWAGLLHVYFYAKKYHLITALYGSKFNGYMGVATAVPIDSFEIHGVHIKRISDLIITPPPSPPTLFQKIVSFLWALFFKNVENPWQKSIARSNQLIAVKLKPRGENASFTIGNYHMPCEFKFPQVMVTHSCLAAQYLQSISDGNPYILAGDFNFKPNSTMYRILTEGEVEPDNVELPPPLQDFSWKACVVPLRSAYLAANGSEPDFTNSSKVRNEQPFVDTLDYIFCSPEWTVESVDQLPNRNELVGPLPTPSEPSDHLMIAANLLIPAI